MPKIGSVILVHDETESVLEARSFPSPAGRCSSRAQRALRCVVGGTDVPTSATLALDEPTASWLGLGTSKPKVFAHGMLYVGTPRCGDPTSCSSTANSTPKADYGRTMWYTRRFYPSTTDFKTAK